MGSSSWSPPGAKPGASPGPTGAGSPSPEQCLVLLFLLKTFCQNFNLLAGF